MSEGEEIKVFHITGQAANNLTGKKKRITRKKRGDESVIPEVTNEGVPSELATLPVVISVTNKPVNMVPPPVSTAPPTIRRENAPPVIVSEHKEGEDDKKIKVELKKKQATKKVQLHPKKDEPQKVPVAKKTETRKKNRRVLLGVSSLHKRMTRAKKMQKTVKEMPLDKLKEELLKKKLIKPTSKAPESVLRQIATDAQIVEGKAL